ncbi:MAG: ParB N-terminal domain-containing protein [Planctomycetes bacterium]|nr:ParB N-terminal domain-containing protein [Planctomycetota bacterium]
MKIEERKVSDIRPYEANPRMNDQAVDAVARSIREFGFRQPFVVDEAGVIIVGHTRWKAAKTLGLAEVPVHVAAGLPPEKVKAYRIADNKLHELSEWDYDPLPVELSDLRGMDIDLDMLGFSSEEVDKMLGAGIGGNPGLTDPDAVPEPPNDPVTQRGDIWVLGERRLMWDDSGSPEDLDRLLSGAVIHLVNTDPPYNVKVEPRSNNAIAAGLSVVRLRRRGRGLRCARHASSGLRSGAGQVQGSADDEEAPPEGPPPRERPRLGRGLRRNAPGVVREHRARAGAWPGLLHLGRLRQRRELPQRAQGVRALLRAGRHLGEGAPGPHAQGLHGQPRVVLLRLARGRGALLQPGDQ